MQGSIQSPAIGVFRQSLIFVERQTAHSVLPAALFGPNPVYFDMIPGVMSHRHAGALPCYVDRRISIINGYGSGETLRPMKRLIPLAIAVCFIGAAIVVWRTSRSAPGGGRRLHQDGRASEWKAQRLPLGNTGFVANAGPVFYNDNPKKTPDYYSVDVEKPDGAVSNVVFQYDFRMAELPSGFTEIPISQIVSYDDSSRTVTFKVGDQTKRYRLEP
jgi:hypothetical protein